MRPSGLALRDHPRSPILADGDGSGTRRSARCRRELRRDSCGASLVVDRRRSSPCTGCCTPGDHGIVVATTRGTESACDAKRDRLVAIEERYGIEGSQSWDDILVLQESSTIAQAYRDAGEREEILEDLAEAGCS